jgi:hypothetical protein
MSFCCHQIDQKTNKLFERISAIKRGWTKDIKALLSLKNYSINGFFMQPLFRGKGRIPYKTFVGFLVDLNTLKGHFEIK